MWKGGTLTTAGNLVFQGTSDGPFMAYDARNGEALWESPVGGGIIAAPATSEVDGGQYVPVMAGWGGSYGVTGGGRGVQRLPRRIPNLGLSGTETVLASDVEPAMDTPLAPEPISLEASCPTSETSGTTRSNGSRRSFWKAHGPPWACPPFRNGSTRTMSMRSGHT